MIDTYMLLKKWEGFKSKPYLCPAGVPTIGYGSTIYPDEKKVTLKDPEISEQYARDILMWYCTTKIKLPKGIWSCNQKEALYCLIYNIGQPAFNISKCRKALETGDWQTAFREWDWNKVRNQKTGKLEFCEGLEKRRKEERELFFKGLL